MNSDSVGVSFIYHRGGGDGETVSKDMQLKIYKTKIAEICKYFLWQPPPSPCSDRHIKSRRTHSFDYLLTTTTIYAVDINEVCASVCRFYHCKLLLTCCFVVAESHKIE